MSSIRWWPAAVLVAGCAKEPAADFTLQLQPLTPTNETPFADSAVISLLIDDTAGAQIWPLDAVDASTFQAAGIGPLTAATVGLLVQAKGADDTKYDASQLVAWGSVGPFDLAQGHEQISAPVLVPAFGGVGELGSLTKKHAALDGSAVMLSNGDVLIFGGAELWASQTNTTSSQVLRLRKADLDRGEWSISQVGEMPDWDGDGSPDKWAGGTADVVDVNGAEMVLLAGGRQDTNYYNGSTSDAALYDPTSDTFAWSNDNKLKSGRTEHRSLVLADGRVLLVGGLLPSGSVAEASFEFFTPNKKSSEYGSKLLTNWGTGFAMADTGATGVLVCGGTVHGGPPSAAYDDPQDACGLIDPSGNVADVAGLPTQLQGLAMAPLPDGKVLACGGINVRAYNGTPTAAVDSAFVYNVATGKWANAGKMSYARVGHQLVAMPDGRVLVIGGMESGGVIAPALATPQTCPEIFDPTTLKFSAYAPCNTAGSGFLPLVASNPDHGAVVIEGVETDYTGGQSYGIVGFPPPL